MAWIETVPPEDATGIVKEAYFRNAKQSGKVSAIRQMNSIAPDILEAWLTYDHTVMYRQGGISRTRREMIATTTSALNGCEY